MKRVLFGLFLAGFVLVCFAPAALAAGSGSLKAWGWNIFGQLGDGTTTSRTAPVDASGLTDVSAVAGGLFHAVALKSDGTAWAWGLNGSGQLGDGTTDLHPTPVQVKGPEGTGFLDGIAVACGSSPFGRPEVRRHRLGVGV